MEQKNYSRISHEPAGYEKAIEIFNKTVDKLPSVDSALQKSICAFGKTVTQSCSVLKRKKTGLIPVQATAKSRRLYRTRGSRTAVQGRSRLSQGLSIQLAVGDTDQEDSGVLRHKLPSKKRKVGSAHSLGSSVSANKRGTKKH